MKIYLLKRDAPGTPEPGAILLLFAGLPLLLRRRIPLPTVLRANPVQTDAGR